MRSSNKSGYNADVTKGVTINNETYLPFNHQCKLNKLLTLYSIRVIFIVSCNTFLLKMSDDIDFDFFESPGRTFPNNFSTNSADNSIESATGNPNSQSQTQSEVNTYTKSNGSSNSSTRSDSRSESQLVNQSAQLRRNNNQRYHKYDSQIEKDFQTETSSRHHNRHDSHTDSDVVKRSDKSKSKSTSKTKVSSHGSRKKHCDYSEKVVVQASIPSVMHESSSSGEDSDSDFFNMALDGDNSNARCNSDSRNMSKPPLPRNAKHSDRYSVNRNKHKYHKDSKHTKTKHSKYVKKREQQLSDEEFSDSASSSEEEVRFHRRTKKDLKIDLGDLSPRSDSSETDSHRSRRTDSHRSRKTDSHRSRSRSISPDWSTGWKLETYFFSFSFFNTVPWLLILLLLLLCYY